MVNWWIQLSGTILILIFIFKLKIDNVAYVPFLGFTWNYLQFSIVYVIYKRIKYLFFKIAAESDPYPFSWYFLSWISKYIATSWYTRSQLLRIYEFMTLIYCLNSLVIRNLIWILDNRKIEKWWWSLTEKKLNKGISFHSNFIFLVSYHWLPNFKLDKNIISVHTQYLNRYFFF